MGTSWSGPTCWSGKGQSRQIICLPPVMGRALWQLVSTLGLYSACWVLMVVLLRRDAPLWALVPLVILAGTLLVRVFIFFHDCCHGSFFASRRANQIVGYFTGLLAFTPFAEWRRAHAIHHVSAGNLDRRGVGDIWTLTREEYLAASRWKRFAYRLYRNPLVLLGPGPFLLFVVLQRFPNRTAGRKANISVLLTDLGAIAMVTIMGFTLGWKEYLVIQIPVMVLAGALGVWLFYVQHQYETVYWARQGAWDATRAAMDGSSYYRLPRVLQWFTGNIGLHHIHHLRPRIPNYHLQRCYDAVPALQSVKPMTIRGSLSSLFLNLYDERQQKLVNVRSLSR